MSYLWIKSLHILAVISWMAGMLYLPRLFVYHADIQHGSAQANLFQTMEYRLQRYIMTPALLVAWLTGLYLAYSAGFFHAPWLHAKLGLVVIMSGLHGYLSSLRKSLASGQNRHTSRFFRIINEAPTVLMIVIVVLVVVKPFS
jgi:protoporphyrinogen IX oxidase